MTAHADSHLHSKPCEALNTWAGGNRTDLKTVAFIPALMTFEEWAAKMNTRAAFERVYWAARGKVWHSVRWRTPWRLRRAWRIDYIWEIIYIGALMRWRTEGITKIPKRGFNMSAKLKRESDKQWCEECWLKQLRRIAPAQWENEDGGVTAGIDEKYLTNLGMNCYALKKNDPSYFSIFKEMPYSILLKYARLIKDAIAIKSIFQIIKQRRITLNILLKYLEAEAFRAHLARRVKPVSRRTRVRRPLYARPRPPTCPLAPPVI